MTLVTGRIGNLKYSCRRSLRPCHNCVVTVTKPHDKTETNDEWILITFFCITTVRHSFFLNAAELHCCLKPITNSTNNHTFLHRNKQRSPSLLELCHSIVKQRAALCVRVWFCVYMVVLLTSWEKYSTSLAHNMRENVTQGQRYGSSMCFCGQQWSDIAWSNKML